MPHMFGQQQVIAFPEMVFYSRCVLNPRFSFQENNPFVFILIVPKTGWRALAGRRNPLYFETIQSFAKRFRALFIFGSFRPEKYIFHLFPLFFHSISLQAVSSYKSVVRLRAIGFQTVGVFASPKKAERCHTSERQRHFSRETQPRNTTGFQEGAAYRVVPEPQP